MNDLPYLLALNRMAGVGPRTVFTLRQYFSELSSLFTMSRNELIDAGLNQRLADIISKCTLDNVDKDLAWAEAPNHHLISLDNPAYPLLLREIPDPPLVLYARGNIDCLKLPAIAMVGTRNPSLAGQHNAKKFARGLSEAGICVVSGLALGIDGCAHQGALDANGQTIAVMATGIDVIYPKRHHQLAHKIMDKGLVMTEFPLQSPPIAGHFPRRNRIISGLSSATLVIEAAIKSGSLITARFALEQNREVLAVPGSIDNPVARGCHHLVQQGAKLVSSVEDVLEELNLHKPQQSEVQQHTIPKEQGLLGLFDYKPVSVDELCTKTSLNMDELLSKLSELELDGLITAVPGGYMRCYE